MIDTLAAMLVIGFVIVGISAYFAGYRHGKTDGWQSGFENGVAYVRRARPDQRGLVHQDPDQSGT